MISTSPTNAFLTNPGADWPCALICTDSGHTERSPGATTDSATSASAAALTRQELICRIFMPTISCVRRQKALAKPGFVRYNKLLCASSTNASNASGSIIPVNYGTASHGYGHSFVITGGKRCTVKPAVRRSFDTPPEGERRTKGRGGCLNRDTFPPVPDEAPKPPARCGWPGVRLMPLPLRPAVLCIRQSVEFGKL